MLIEKYFSDLSPIQKTQFEDFQRLFKEWNEKVNLVSRKDIDNFEINHLLHSLAIAKFIKFRPGTTILDLGSGGGLPGVPLAIMFPDVKFTLVDRTGKKMKAAQDMIDQLGLENVKAIHGDAKDLKDKYDFVVSRAVMPQPDLVKLAYPLISNENKNSIANGIIALKGGDLTSEISPVKKYTEIQELNKYFEEPFFDTKKIIYTC